MRTVIGTKIEQLHRSPCGATRVYAPEAAVISVIANLIWEPGARPFINNARALDEVNGSSSRGECGRLSSFSSCRLPWF